MKILSAQKKCADKITVMASAEIQKSQLRAAFTSISEIQRLTQIIMIIG